MASGPRDLGPADLQKLAALARLQLPTAQADELLRRLSVVVQTFASLRQVDTSSLAADAAPPAPDRRRPDVAEPTPAAEAVLANAPAAVAESFVVPRVVEG